MDQVAAIAIASGAAFVLTKRCIPAAMVTLFERGIYGIDINKTTLQDRQVFGKIKRSGGEFDPEMKKRVVPESLGIVVGAVYLCLVIVALLYVGCSLAKMNAALCTIALMLLLGFVDDVLDLKWRHKMLLSAISTLPLLSSYDGSTSIVLPIPVREYFDGAVVLHLGVAYLVYIGLFCIFCTNSINILAGVNGVEVGQSIVIAAAMLVHNGVHWNGPDSAGHRMSAALLGPFLGASIALWVFNRYPSRVFVGDSYTYFAGMTLAVAGVSGGYTKTLMLFFTPQLINFVLSLPQLFHIVECPRHRVPRWNDQTNKLENSRNYTILNAILFFTGPLHERTLTYALLAFQATCCALAFAVRYWLAGLVYENVN